MKKLVLPFLAILLAAGASAQEKPKIKFKPYGFIRNYYAFDTRESVAMTEDLFFYVPKDVNLNEEGDDLNENPSFKYTAITTRIGLDITGFSLGKWDFAARIEADFNAGISATGNDPTVKGKYTGTAQLRLRQAFVSVGNGAFLFKAGQTWHPMAADMPHVIGLNSGAPFGPFSRTPLVSVDWNIFKTGLTLTGAFLWQMQYNSTGPYGTSANYVRDGGYEFYAGLNYKNGGFLARAGVDLLHITPRLVTDAATDKERLKVKEGLTTWSPFLYLQFTSGAFQVKAKTIFAQSGEHMCLNGGYAVTGIKEDGRSYIYTPTRNSSTWVSVQYAPGKWQFMLFGGYVKNLGTMDKVMREDMLYFSQNSFTNLNSMWRVTPTVIYNIGKRLAVGVEYEHTCVQYGTKSLGMNLETGLYDQGIHDVTNHRVQGIVKFTF